jgi:hypothetical protein
MGFCVASAHGPESKKVFAPLFLKCGSFRRKEDHAVTEASTA